MRHCIRFALARWVSCVLPFLFFGAPLRAVVINEILYHPSQDPATLEFIELFNPRLEAVSVAGWSMARGVRFVFPSGTVIEPRGFLIVCANRDRVIEHFGVSPAAAQRVLGNWGGFLDDGGERLLLVDAAGLTVDEVTYDDTAPWDEAADGTGPSLQRVCFRIPGFHTLNWAGETGELPSPLSENLRSECPPPGLPAPIVTINEIHYHPPGDRDELEEFVELRNNSLQSINLKGYSFADGIDFVFDDDTLLEPGGLIVVCRNREHMEFQFDVENAVGNFSGRLSNDGERITFVDPDGSVADSVAYGDSELWPVAPDGLGYSLEKVVPDVFSDDPQSWQPATKRESDDGAWRRSRVAATLLSTESTLVISLDAAGEVLVDDLVIEDVQNPGVNLVPNGDFNAGLDPWLAAGNHDGSRWAPEGGPDGSGALHVIATDLDRRPRTAWSSSPGSSAADRTH